MFNSPSGKVYSFSHVEALFLSLHGMVFRISLSMKFQNQIDILKVKLTLMKQCSTDSPLIQIRFAPKIQPKFNLGGYHLSI